MQEESETDKKISPPTPGLSVEPPVNEAALAASAAAAAASEVAAAMREFSQSRAKGNRPSSALLLYQSLLSCPSWSAFIVSPTLHLVLIFTKKIPFVCLWAEKW